MIKRVADFCKYSLAFWSVLALCWPALAEQAPNPRGSSTASVTAATSDAATGATSRANSSRVVRVNSAATSGTTPTTTSTVSGRAAATTVSRSATSRPSTTVARSANIMPSATNVVTGRSGTIRQTIPTSATAARSATTSRAASSNVVRGATHNPASTARAASTNSVVGASRASTARATAVFTDISAIGGGYAECREAYATCMDQFCANANDTYRRCVCSARYDEFRDTENAIDQALNLLAQFQDNNLTAVNLTAEEVTAMYTATEGENAIKRDTSAAANMLSEISDLLSGNSSSSSSSSSSGTSLGLLTVDFTSDLGDIWGDSGSSIFDTSTGVDLSTLTGQDLYNEASKQCLDLIADSCENNAVLTMARSAYSIMITQDCNLYEKNINSQKEGLEQTVRTAEKYLREARLEEYQSHNSADVNECIANVRSAIQADTACGPNYQRCLDYTGAYINQSTGEPIYSPRLFELTNMILLPGVNASNAGDVLSANSEFNTFLDDKRMFAESALDTCRDISDIVWEEFKRQALIEIAQAQDEKIEEVKMSCVSTMAECYDTQTGALQDFDNTTSQYTGAISAYAARSMCQDQVIACASLYGDTSGCQFDGNGKLVAGTGNNSSSLTGTAAADRCGLTALLAFVDTVDTVRITEGCETAIDNYLADLCTPDDGEMGYPWNCRNMSPDELEESIQNFASQNCADPTSSGDAFITAVGDQISRAIDDIQEELDYQLMETCEELDGYWMDDDDSVTNVVDSRVSGNGTLLSGFYRQVYGGNEVTDWGRCVENTTMLRCLDYNDGLETPVASYDLSRDECTFTDEWYRAQCEELMGGYYENSVCYVAE